MSEAHDDAAADELVAAATDELWQWIAPVRRGHPARRVVAIRRTKLQGLQHIVELVAIFEPVVAAVEPWWGRKVGTPT